MSVTLTERKVLKDETQYTGVHPLKFALWLGMASITMFFVAITSALLVKKGDYKVWENFKLPSVFIASTVTVVLISVVMQMALAAYRKAQFKSFRRLMFFSFFLGLLFLGLQLFGWHQLRTMGMTLTANVSGSFIYLITSMHGLHIIGGLVVMMFFLVSAVRSRKDPIYELRNVINPRRELHLELLVIYWHFVDAVWIYLYIFFLLNYQ